MNNKLYIKTDISLLIDIFLFNHTYVLHLQNNFNICIFIYFIIF